MRRVAGIVVLCATGGLALAAPAHAVHWPFFGGDNGRSGNQPVDVGGLPVPFVHSVSGAGEGPVKTSIVTTTGQPSSQRLIFGTADGRIHLQVLATGAPVGPEEGTALGSPAPDADALGSPATRASLTPADTSTAAGLGQLFVVHNDDDATPGAPDVEIAQIDETTGEPVTADVDVAGTDGFTATSSVVATSPAPDGSRVLFFLAQSGSDQRLVRVPITGDARLPESRADGAAATMSAADIDATPDSSPALVAVPDAMGTPIPYVAVGATNRVRTYRVDDLGAGPESDALGGAVFTPSVPVQPSGLTPGPGQTLTGAPWVYVAVSGAGSTTVLFKLRPGASGLATNNNSALLPGLPAPALAVTQSATSTNPGPGKVVVTTGANLYVLDTDDLTTDDRLSPAPLTPGTTGFLRTTAAVSGELAYVTRDNGEQLVVRLSDAQPVAGSDFSQHGDVVTAPSTGIGQPSISRGFVQFGAANGVFVHLNADLVDPVVTLTSPTDGATLSGETLLAATATDARGVARVDFRLNGQAVASDTTADGSSFAELIDSRGIANGTYTADAVATDTGGRTATSPAVQVTVANATTPGAGGGGAAGDDRPPVVAFSAPARGALVRRSQTVTATATDDRGVVSVAFLDGARRAICTDTTAPYSCTYRPGGASVGRQTLLAVAVDTAGQSATDARNVVVSRFAPGVSASTSPSRDRRAPYRFRTTGRVRLPSGVTAAQACGKGRVSVQIKTLPGSRTISNRRVGLRRNCTFSSTVTFRTRARFRGPLLRVSVRFLANDVLLPRSAPRRSVRVG